MHTQKNPSVRAFATSSSSSVVHLSSWGIWRLFSTWFNVVFTGTVCSYALINGWSLRGFIFVFLNLEDKVIYISWTMHVILSIVLVVQLEKFECCLYICIYVQSSFFNMISNKTLNIIMWTRSVILLYMWAVCPWFLKQAYKIKHTNSAWTSNLDADC